MLTAESDIYCNDFSTRTSAGAIPAAEWREVKYTTGILANPGTYSGDIWTYGNWKCDAFGGADLQDNWIKGRNNCEANAYVADDDGNCKVIVCCPEEKGDSRLHGIFKHRLGNIFTTGVVTAQCDFLPPTSWKDYNPLAVRFILGDEKFFSPDTDQSDYMKYTACATGVGVSGSDYKFVGYGADGGASAESGVWYRVVVVADLAASTCRVSFYKLGSEHPTLDTPTPATPVCEMVDSEKASKDIPFYSVTKGVVLSGISSVGFGAWGVGGKAGDTSRSKMAQFDNIRISHDGNECYVNDFSSRRSRSMTAGTVIAEYMASGSLTNNLKYANDTMLVAAQVQDNSVQEIGFDGWRRINKDGGHSLTTGTHTWNQSGRMSTDTWGFGIAASPFGQTFTSGKVRLSVDSYVDKMDNNNNEYGVIRVVLGDDALYNGSYSTYLNGRFAEAGIHGQAVKVEDTWQRQIQFLTNEDGEVLRIKPGDGVDPGQWLRYIVEADLDAGTYDFAVYKPIPSSGSHPSLNDPDGELIYSKTGIAKPYATVNYISCFALMSYYAIAWFDNIKVWYTSSSSAERKRIYSNSFSTRSVITDESALVGAVRKNPVGMDGWTRLGRSEDEIKLVGLSNPALGFGVVGSDKSAWAAHDLGVVLNGGMIATRFDVCAPAGDGCGYVWLGGDQLHEGNLSGRVYGFEKWAAMGAGISNGKFAVWSGDGSGGGSWIASETATAGHWYRFVVKSNLSVGKYDVEIYDMGMQQPVASVATPNTGSVAGFTDVSFRRNITSGAGVSCIAVEGKGVQDEGNPLLPGYGRLLIDNICVCRQLGFCIMFR